MTEKETSQLLAVILEVYPAFGKGRDPKFTTRIWHALFQNIPFEQAKQALMIFIATDTKGFAPAPGMIREIILDAGKQEEMSTLEAWERTERAISRGLYYGAEEFRKLPPEIQTVIRSPERLHQWASMDEWTIQHSVAPWFQRAYEDQMEREHRTRLLPGNLRIGAGPD